MTKVCWVSRRHQAGYSAVELLMTLGVLGVVSAMAALQFGSAQPSMKGDGAMRVVVAQLNTARELAITQRRNMQVILSGNQVQVVRQEVPTGTTVLSTVPFEGGVQFALTTGVPDTPDGFGMQSAVDFGSATAVMFGTEGMLIDQIGNPVNGTISLALANQARSARAVTILGSTGRIRGYKWDGIRWVAA